MLIYVAQLNPTIGNLTRNTEKILNTIEKARLEKAEVIVFPEAAISGYPPEDLLLYDDFIDQMQVELDKIIEASKDLFIVVGTIRRNKEKKGNLLFNSAAVIYDGKLLGFKDKSLLPTYDVFVEKRYFEPGIEQKVFKFKGKKIGVLICEDVWAHSENVYKKYEIDPIKELQKLKPDLLINIAASPYCYEKKDLRIDVFSKVSKTLNCPHIMCNQVGANDQLVFDGHSMYFDKEGNLINVAKGFVEDHLLIDIEKQTPVASYQIDPMQDLYNALVLGVKDYFRKLHLSKALIGLSGGIDSALVLCIAADALGPLNVLALNMPSRFSSISSFEDANLLAANLRVELMDIPIDHMYQQYLDLLSPVFAGKSFDTTEENLQARIRGMILMAISNKLGYIVLSTGNKSEMAMGYVTLYGDMCGGLGVLNDVTKSLVYELAKWINRKKEIIPSSIIKKEPSAELKADQKDQDTLPPYSVVDKVIDGYVEDHLSIDEIVKKYKIDETLVKELVERIHRAEYKRRQGPPGIRVSKKAFSKGRFFPIVQGWIAE
ncbi:MAG: Glutamine-dependent NAD(+) synthetase [Candidatus Anoxychlamydiales bacterium]|nr:Glutamine-dependent NAD(+) synthetase [Candidatus Anoxychlamydiales bacterium]